MQYYTTIEQSKKLVKLGLNPKSADMHYPMLYHRNIDNGGKNLSDFPITIKPISIEGVPCWSLGALLEVMPMSIEEVKEHKLELLFGKLHKEKWGCSYFDWTEIQHGPFTVNDTPLEAAYTMVCWLLENGYIKKGE